MPNLKEKLKNLPKKPGVYQFLNKAGGVIYIGKAKNLRARVAQYFGTSDGREQVPYLMAEAADINYTVVNNELESLYLENTLIKQYLPKYNILLRDDKNYAFIKIDYSTEIPQIAVVRKIDPPSPRRSPLSPSHYFGPYSAAYKIKNTLNLVRRIFPYCSAQKVGARPCFYYYLHRCPGVCIGKIPLEEYNRQIERIANFLAGNTGKIKKELQKEMKITARAKKFEAAARLRDQLNSLRLLEEKQTVILAKKVDWDIISLAQNQGFACVNLFKIREGKMRDKENFVYELTSPSLSFERRGMGPSSPLSKGELEGVMQKFLEQYYVETSSIPQTIYTQIPAEDGELIEYIIKSRFDKKIKVLTPQKGKPQELVKMGTINAEEYLKNWLSNQAGQLDKINSALVQLKEILRLEKVPERIEGYDISNIQGANAVGSMVVFEKGLPKKSAYRKFKIYSKTAPDDFAMMKEMLERRFARLRSVPNSLGWSQKQPINRHATKSDDKWPTPDLIVIDGGKGQLSAALEALQKFQITNSKLQIPIIGLAKRLEEIYLPDKKDPIILTHNQPALQLLQRLRDEAHRFGITSHRQLRSKQAVKSALDDISGIGPKTKKLLKAKFGTVANIRKTSLDDLAAVVGRRLAKIIRQSL